MVSCWVVMLAGVNFMSGVLPVIVICWVVILTGENVLESVDDPVMVICWVLTTRGRKAAVPVVLWVEPGCCRVWGVLLGNVAPPLSMAKSATIRGNAMMITVLMAPSSWNVWVADGIIVAHLNSSRDAGQEKRPNGALPSGPFNI